MKDMVNVFSIIPVEAFMDDRLTKTDLRVLGSILSFRDIETNLCWPKREQISKRCNLSNEKISTATSRMVELGWLEKDGDGGRSRSTRYKLRVPRQLIKTVPESGTVPESETVPDSGIKTVPDSGTRIEQTSEQTKENKNARDILKNGFDDFWEAYPKKRSKTDAERAWKKLNPDEQLQQTIIAAVILATTQDFEWTKNEGQYIPYPASWLRGKRWLDERQNSNRSGSDTQKTRGIYETGNTSNAAGRRNSGKLSLAEQAQRDADFIEQQERGRYARVINDLPE